LNNGIFYCFFYSLVNKILDFAAQAPKELAKFVGNMDVCFKGGPGIFIRNGTRMGR